MPKVCIGCRERCDTSAKRCVSCGKHFAEGGTVRRYPERQIQKAHIKNEPISPTLELPSAPKSYPFEVSSREVKPNSVELDEVVSKFASAGVPGLVVAILLVISPYAGGAAITWMLALIGGPFGMLGGIAVLLLSPMAVKAIAKHKAEDFVRGVINELKAKGTSKQEILNRINSYPISAGMKTNLTSYVNSLP